VIGLVERAMMPHLGHRRRFHEAPQHRVRDLAGSTYTINSEITNTVHGLISTVPVRSFSCSYCTMLDYYYDIGTLNTIPRLRPSCQLQSWVKLYPMGGGGNLHASFAHRITY
jgi:hypothetical protein